MVKLPPAKPGGIFGAWLVSALALCSRHHSGLPRWNDVWKPDLAPLNSSPCYGLIEIVVDGHLDRYPIYLHAGITPGSKFIDFRNVPAGLLDERQALLFDDDKAIPGCPF
jgi:hypothetical protein